MSTGLEVFDSTVQKTNVWLSHIERELEILNRHEAYRILRSVLQALRDQLDPAEAADLAAGMPMLVRGFYYEGWQPAKQTHVRDEAGFENLVYAYHGSRPYLAAPEMISVVGKVLREMIPGNEFDQVLARLSEPVRRLFERKEHASAG